MRIKWKPLIISVLLPLVVGGLSALLAGNSMEAFQSFKQPPLSPPGWLFPIVWTALYVLMGVASYLVAASDAPAGEIKNALKAYAIQLAINFFWSILFFRFGLLWFSFFWLLLLWGFLVETIILFGRISKTAGLLLIPYLLWVTFAGYLNFAVALLN